MTSTHRTLTVLLAVLFAVSAHGSAEAQNHPRLVEVRVDSVVASDTNGGVDVRLGHPMTRRLQGLFNYNTYRLVSHQNNHTKCGDILEFTLPGGRILHVQPRAVDGDMIVMELNLFDGARPMMTTDLKLRNNGILMIGGPRYEQGMLIISIGASSADPGPGSLNDRQVASPLGSRTH
ncbi:MAG TPA: hypothetical protein VIX59_20470 [Candidatus Binataceae bacterium]